MQFILHVSIAIKLIIYNFLAHYSIYVAYRVGNNYSLCNVNLCVELSNAWGDFGYIHFSIMKIIRQPPFFTRSIDSLYVTFI